MDLSQVPLWCVPGKMTGCTGTSVACTGAEDRLNRHLCGVRQSSSQLDVRSLIGNKPSNMKSRATVNAGVMYIKSHHEKERNKSRSKLILTLSS